MWGLPETGGAAEMEPWMPYLVLSIVQHGETNKRRTSGHVASPLSLMELSRPQCCNRHSITSTHGRTSLHISQPKYPFDFGVQFNLRQTDNVEWRE